MTTSRNVILDAALNYLRDGFSVVRVIPGQKRVYGSWAEYQRRLPIEREINDWYSRPYFQLGMVCGPVSGGFFALDFDGESWETYFQMFMRRFPDFLNTRAVRTGSWKFHLWGRCQGLSNIIQRLSRGRIERIFPGEKHEAIELRLDRCIMLAPPSTHPSGTTYQFFEPINPILEFSEERLWEIVEFLREGQPERQHRQTQQGETPDLTDERQRRLANFYVRVALGQVENGAGRNEKGFQLGCNLRDLGLSEEDARAFMEEYQRGVPERDHSYTIDEAINSLGSAYENERKEPWIPDGFFGPDDGALGEERIQKLIAYPLTDAGNAESFIEIHGDHFIFVPEKRKWFMWDGVRWMEDEYEPRLSMLNTVRIKGRLSERVSDEHRRSEFRKWNVGSESMGKIKSALESAEYMNRKNLRLFDSESYMLCCENGVVNLRIGEFRRANHNDWLSKSTGVNYDPEAQCPRWLQFLEEVFQGDRELIGYIKKSVGYSLTGDTSEQCLFVGWGKGANGKSTFLEVVGTVIGEYAQTLPSITLKEHRNENNIPNDVARTCGARFVKMIEVKERAKLNEERIKSLTGGDKITARFLHQEWFEFYPQFKIWLAANHKPIIKDTSEGIWRRIHLIPFEAYFPPEAQDQHLVEILREEKSGILNWAIEGCLEWQSGGLRPPSKVINATRQYRNESDVFGRFLYEECKDEGEESSERLYGAFCRWWRETEEDDPWTQTTFGRKLTEKGYERYKTTTGNRAWHYRGISLKETDCPE
jgi:putative DNA primase/helicase